MGKEITYKLDYRELGEKKSIEIKIDFLSRGIARDFENLRLKQFDFKEKVLKLRELEYLINDYKVEKPDGYKAALKELYEEADEVSKDILSFDKDLFIDEQMNLLQKILKDNGVEYKMLYDNDFWENKVDVEVMNDFLIAVVEKDSYLKKKQKEQE